MRGDDELPEGETGWPLMRPLRDFKLGPRRLPGTDKHPDRDVFIGKIKKRRTKEDILAEHAKLVMEMEALDD